MIGTSPRAGQPRRGVRMSSMRGPRRVKRDKCPCFPASGTHRLTSGMVPPRDTETAPDLGPLRVTPTGMECMHPSSLPPARPPGSARETGYTPQKSSSRRESLPVGIQRSLLSTLLLQLPPRPESARGPIGPSACPECIPPFISRCLPIGSLVVHCRRQGEGPPPAPKCMG